MAKKSQKELLQISFMILLIFGLLISLGLLIWMSFPSSKTKLSKVEIADEDYEYEESDLTKGPLVFKLKGTFEKIPKSNGKVLFDSDEGLIQLKIPSDFPNNFKMSPTEVNIRYLGTYNDLREFHLLGYKSLDDNVGDSWKSLVRPKPRIRSSSWYYF